MRSWQHVVAFGESLPGVEESTWYGTPALKVGGKGFVRLRSEAEGGLMVTCDLAEKEALLASGDPAFYTTPHYDGYGAVLIDLERVGEEQLHELLTEAWRIKASARLRHQLEDG